MIGCAYGASLHLAGTKRGMLRAAVCVGLTAALSACGLTDPDAGTNGVGKLSPEKIEKKTRSAAERARSVKLSGNVVVRGRNYQLSMRLKQDGATGKVSVNGGRTFWLLRIGKDLYLKADSAFWARQESGGGKQPSRSDIEAAGKLDGKYVKVPSGDPAYKQLSGFADMRLLLDGLLMMTGERETGDRNEVGGTETVRVQGGGGSGGIVDVSLHGAPYPLRIERAGGAGTLELQDWNKEFPLEAPAKQQVVDYGRKIFAQKG